MKQTLTRHGTTDLSMIYMTVMYFSPESDCSVFVGFAFMKFTLKCFLMYVQDPNDIMQV